MAARAPGYGGRDPRAGPRRLFARLWLPSAGACVRLPRRVPAPPDRQPRRGRRARRARRARARHRADRRRLRGRPRRGLARARWTRSCASGPRRARESYLRRRARRPGRAADALRARCTRAGASWPRTRASRRCARSTASRSSARAPAVMERMGRKSPAKAAMRAAGLDGDPGLATALLATRTRRSRCAREIGLPGDPQGRRRRRRARDAPVPATSASSRAPSPRRAPRPRRPSANGALYLERYLEPADGTSRCRSSATASATPCTSASASARSSATTRS